MAGLAAAGGAAFTGGGLTDSTSGDGFVGGTATQTIIGATLSSVDYHEAPGTDLVASITLTFADGADGQSVSAVGTGDGPGDFECTNISVGVQDKSTCTYHADASEVGFDNLTALAISVS